MQTAGTLTAQRLTEMYINRIAALDTGGPQLNSILEINADALDTASELDRERAQGNVRGPLHGIPILLKDSIDTADQMETTAGSLALLGSKPLQDATVVAKLREAGAIILGKTGMSEWSNFRGAGASSGWSARGGQVRNPYVTDRSPSGSSSGSGTAISANLAAAALGVETNGSIIFPAAATGIVGIKPSLGLTSRAGVIPISHSQDSVGPMTRTVADTAAVLTAIAGADSRDPATTDAQNTGDYTQYLDPDGLNGARIGVARELFGFFPAVDAVIEDALVAMQNAGATIVDHVTLPNLWEIEGSWAEWEVNFYEFRPDLEAYLAGRSEGSPRTLEEIIQFNWDHADVELQWFGQEYFLAAAERGSLDDPAYLWALETSRDGSRAQLDAALDGNDLDALVAPSGGLPWPINLSSGDQSMGITPSPAARAGYPLITVPAGFAGSLPTGITFMGRLWAEPTLIKLASGFEAISRARRAPRFER